MPSAARTILLEMTGSLNDDELERIRKESNVAWFEVCQVFSGGSE